MLTSTSSGALTSKRGERHDVARACFHQHAVCDVAGAAQPRQASVSRAASQVAPSLTLFFLFGTGARAVFRALLSAEEPDRRRDDGCHPAIDERREERLLLLGLRHARARRWLPV